MKEDRLRRDKAEIHNLNDLIDARSEKLSHIAADVDAFGEDIDIPDSLDASEALTFPHPKHKPADNPELMGEPYEVDMDEDWDAQDAQPTDYEHAYDEGTDAHATDDPDRAASERIHELGHATAGDMADNIEVEIMPARFQPDEESGT